VGTILHLIRAADYLATGDQPVVVDCPPGGFIHCTATAELLLEVANAFYHYDHGDYLALELDPARLQAELRWEPPDPAPPPGSPLAGQMFPHLYGPIHRHAVVAVRAARRAADGTFLAT
jgi:uncharacterized protein (DUF952 family)